MTDPIVRAFGIVVAAIALFLLWGLQDAISKNARNGRFQISGVAQEGSYGQRSVSTRMIDTRTGQVFELRRESTNESLMIWNVVAPAPEPDFL